MYPKELRYAETHEWIRFEDGEGLIGLTAYAVEKLKDVVFIELPALGSKVKRGSPCGVIESVKAVFDLNAPVSGEVTGVNEALKTNVEPVVKDPHNEGWIARIKLEDRNELNDLMNAQEYENYIKGAG